MMNWPYRALMLRVAMACSLSLNASACFAWGAIAANNVGGTHLHTNANTPESARAQALEGCRRTTQKDCKLVMEPGERTAFVVATGTGGNGYAMNPDPRVAARKALASCDRVAKHCKVVSVGWDGGPRWFASAISDKGVGAAGFGSTPQVAAERAVARCEQGTGGKCRQNGDPIGGTVLVYYATAASRSNPATNAYAFGDTAAEADRQAIRFCKTVADDCGVVERETNDYLPAPLMMGQVEAMVQVPAAEAKMPPMEKRSAPITTPVRCINPATGLPMTALDGSCSGFDVMGNPYGMKTH